LGRGFGWKQVPGAPVDNGLPLNLQPTKAVLVRFSQKIGMMALAFCAVPGFAQNSLEERVVWKMEHSYWEDVKALDLARYRALWHENFVGWPGVSPAPVRKDHITEWLTAYTAKGLRLQSYVLKPADSQATGDVVVTHYWLSADWVDEDGHITAQTTRITHTWIRAGHTWQIIGGMSSPEPATGK
jgi:ketosteroid isomerase-like protein